MNKNTGVVIAIIVIILVVLGGAYVLTNQSEPESMSTEQNESSAVQNQPENTVAPETVAPKADEGSAMAKAGSYESYNQDKLALADSGDVVLFFRAPWCPTCRALDANIKANLGNIPTGVTILDVDYDSSTALKQKYGVTYQHTLVQVDSQGNQVAKWTGSPTLASLLTNIK